jgi:hypothetical protein
MKAQRAYSSAVPSGVWPSDKVLARIRTGPGSEYEREEWLPRELARFPSEFHEALVERWIADCADPDTKKAARTLLALREQLRPEAINMASSDDAICTFAEQCSAAVRGLMSTAGHIVGYLLAICFVVEQGIAIPEKTSNDALLRRLTDVHWWRKQLRIQVARRAEHAAIKLGRVRKQCGMYVSDSSLERIREQKQRNRRTLEQMIAVSDLGDEVPLSDIADHSLANPACRRPELMARFAGFDAYAQENGDVGFFITITCPSRMHARLAHSGAPNPKYDNTDPAAAHAYLNRVWARARAHLSRQRLRPYGFRIAEPQHDGTPHWHFLLYTPRRTAEILIETIRSYALAEDETEDGAAEHRVVVTEIDRNRGSGTAYVAKYVAKNVDGEHLDAAEAPRTRAERVNAWARIWGIRQFQQIGGPVVDVWRELRRVRPNDAPDAFAAASAAADAGDWHAFVMHMGGATVRRDAMAFRTAKASTREPGRYGDPKPARTVGVRFGNIVLPTRFRIWQLKRRTPERNRGPPA